MRRLNLVVAGLFLAACGSKGIETNLGTKKPEPAPPPFVFKSTFPDVMEFQQGLENSFNLIDNVEVNGGTPQIAIDNLPQEATFDGRVLTWKPSCDLPDEFFGNGYGLHYVTVVLKRANDPQQFMQHRAVLIVHKYPEYDDFKCEDAARRIIRN